MPSNNDLKHRLDDAIKNVDRPMPSAPIGDMSVEHDTSVATDYDMEQEFTFFQKNKHPSTEHVAPVAAYVSAAQVMALMTRFDSAAAATAKNQRHITELMGLMSDIAQELTHVEPPKNGAKRLTVKRRSTWLFYGCLGVFGLGWFFLFPSGQRLMSQVVYTLHTLFIHSLNYF